MESGTPGRIRRTAGYLLLGISAAAALALAVLPFLDITLAEGTVIAVGLVIAAEAAYLLGLALVGRELWRKTIALLRAQLEELKRGKPRD